MGEVYHSAEQLDLFGAIDDAAQMSRAFYGSNIWRTSLR